MSRVYKIKYKVKKEDLEKLGYEEFPIEIAGKELIMYKTITVPKDSNAVKTMIGIYNNPTWQKQFLTSPDDFEYFKQFGIEFEEIYDDTINNKKLVVKETDEFIERLAECWRVEVEMDKEKWLGITAGIADELPGFYNKAVLDQYCPNEIKELFDNGLVTIAEVKDRD